MNRTSAAFGKFRVRSFLTVLLVIPAYAASPADVSGGRARTVVLADVKTGRLVRMAVGQPAPFDAKLLPAKADLEKLIDRIATEQGVETPLVHSVIRAESNYNAGAVSSKGAQGIMQLIPGTAKRFGVSDAFNAQQNIQGGVKYLKFLLNYYQGDYAKAIAAYNAGEYAVDKYHGIPPYAETQNYVTKVGRNLQAARLERIKTSPKPAEDPMHAETTHPIQASKGSDGLVYYRNP